MIHPGGTFDYAGTVGSVGAFPWTVELHSTRDPAQPSLGGSHPHLVVDEAGVVANAGYDRAVWRPAVLRARFSLATGRWSLFSRTVAQFHVDRSLAAALQPGDTLNLSSTGCGGIGVSAVRDRQLVFAVGAITAVPLGDGITARTPADLVEEAQAVFRRADPDFCLPQLPLEIVAGSRRFLSLCGVCDMGSHEVRVFSGFQRGVPGVDESAAISCRGLCSSTGANASAQLLAADRFGG